jgi:6-phosphogluconolactonase
MRRMLFAAAPLAAGLGSLALAAGPAAAAGPPTTVYTSSNAAAGNAVLAYHQDRHGNLEQAGSFATGGNGSGGGLNNQGALALGPAGRTLFAVNAGSNSVSAFDSGRGDGLRLIGATPSGGPQPVSITVRGDRLYVLNGGDNSVSGFNGAFDGHLRPISGAHATLPGDGPAEVSFSDDGSALVVTERNSNTIDTVALRRDGSIGNTTVTPSNGATPFGFAFDGRDHLVVSEAGGGPNGTSAVSSYRFFPGAPLTTISASVGDTQLAACWLTVTPDGRFAYTANAASPSISSYRIGHGGSLTLRNSVAASNPTGSHTTDLAVPNSGRSLFALTAGNGTLSAYRVDADGGLAATGTGAGVPASATGLVTR